MLPEGGDQVRRVDRLNEKGLVVEEPEPPSANRLQISDKRSAASKCTSDEGPALNEKRCSLLEHASHAITLGRYASLSGSPTTRSGAIAHFNRVHLARIGWAVQLNQAS